MGLATFSIYKYVRTAKGWRYCRPVFGKNNRLKPDAELVEGREEVHAEGAYFLNVDGRWENCGKTVTDAQAEQTRRLARQRYTRETGESLPEPEQKGELLAVALEVYLAELQLKVAGKSRRPKTLAASRQALNEFAEQSGIRYASEINAAAIAKHMAWCIASSPSKSSRTASNKFVLILQFLKHTGLIPTVGAGRSARPLGLRDAPRFTEKPVEKYTDAELVRFFFSAARGSTPSFKHWQELASESKSLQLSAEWTANLTHNLPALESPSAPNATSSRNGTSFATYPLTLAWQASSRLGSIRMTTR